MNWHRKIAVSIALLALASLGLAVDYVKLQRAMDGARSPSQVQRVLKQFDVSNADDVKLAAKAGAIVNVPVPQPEAIEELRDEVRVRALASGMAAPGNVDVSKLQKLKKSPLYNDPGAQSESNWLQKAFSSLGEWLKHLFDRPERPQSSSSGPTILPEFITTLVWIVIGLVAAGCLYLVGAMVVNNAKRVKSSKSLMSDEEAAMTVDEWLAKAEALIAQGEFREAVRCLYVACLLRLDQCGALEFRRFETNWEHYNRFRNRKSSVDFNLLTPTKEFDVIWYGNRTQGREDAERFRGYYESLMRLLNNKEKAA